jgi:hypothetical protein
MESPLRMISQKELVLFPPKKAAIQKLKLLLFITNYHRVESEGRCSCRGELSN